MKGYVIYDGRAMYDTFDAAVYEACLNGRKDLEQGLQTWKDTDAVLVEYDCVNDELQNERVIGHLSEGTEALLGRLAVGESAE
jgi:hypothetical protein